MRGDDFLQDAVFSYISPEERVPQDHPLRAIRQMVDQVLVELCPAFDRLLEYIEDLCVPEPASPGSLWRRCLLGGSLPVRQRRSPRS